MSAASRLLQLCLAGGPHPVALRSGSDDSRLDCSADALRRAVRGIAAALRDRAEDTWALWLPGPFEFLSFFLGLALAGKRMVLPGDMQPGTAEQLSGHFDALISRDSFPGLPKAVLPPHRIWDGTGDAQAADLTPPDAGQIDIQLYTSGSTGTPKAVHKTLALLETELALLQHQWGEALGGRPVVATVSHQHIYGLLHAVLWPFYRGAAFADGILQYPEELCAQAAALGSVTLVSSPTHLKRLPLNHRFVQDHRHFAQVFSSAGLLDAETATTLGELLARPPLEILGSTETGGVAWRQQQLHPAWRPLPGVRCRGDEQGRLVVYSEHLPQAWRRSGYTLGDQVEFCADGGFILRGRDDRVVKVEGKRLSLTAMEQHLRRHEWVADARALVVEGKREETAAVVELSPLGRAELAAGGKLALNTALRSYLLQFFEPPLLPRRWRYVTEWPADSQGKVVLRDLRQLFREARD